MRRTDGPLWRLFSACGLSSLNAAALSVVLAGVLVAPVLSGQFRSQADVFFVLFLELLAFLSIPPPEELSSGAVASQLGHGWTRRRRRLSFPGVEEVGQRGEHEVVTVSFLESVVDPVAA